jgi:hypothetical protein
LDVDSVDNRPWDGVPEALWQILANANSPAHKLNHVLNIYCGKRTNLRYRRITVPFRPPSWALLNFAAIETTDRCAAKSSRLGKIRAVGVWQTHCGLPRAPDRRHRDGDHGLLANTDIIADDQLAARAWPLLKSGYGAYLMELLEPPSL